MRFFLLFLLFCRAKKASLCALVDSLRSKRSNASCAFLQSYKSICRYSFLVLRTMRRLYIGVDS